MNQKSYFSASTQNKIQEMDYDIYKESVELGGG